MVANLNFKLSQSAAKIKCINEFEIDQDFAIKIEKDIILLGVQIDENLKFDSHICKKAAKQLNSLKRVARFMGNREKR